MASNGAAKTLRRLLMREVGQEPAEQEGAKQQLITREPLKAYQYTEQAYLTTRTRRVAQYFPRALGLDDFLNRLEIALFAYGFTGENCIAMSNLCRDEITASLKQRLDNVFGSSFNTNGLGGVLTCGVTGVKAGLSHSPISEGSGKERYVFMSFPHISINALGAVGQISRPGRPGQSCACGALNAALADIKATGIKANCKKPGVHEALDPEYSILKQRLARRMRYEGMTEEDVEKMDLVQITKIAERTIHDDMEFLIKQTVDPRKADYAVISGIQIHSWGEKFDDEAPNLEFIAPCSVYCVVAGERTYLDLFTIPGLTPRQISVLSSAGASDRAKAADPDEVCNVAGNMTTVRSADPPYSYNNRESRRAARQRAAMYAQLIDEADRNVVLASSWPGGWQSRIKANSHKLESDNSCTMDETYDDDDTYSSEDA
ncbi:g8049 [Coccomyxa elongata]